MSCIFVYPKLAELRTTSDSGIKFVTKTVQDFLEQGLVDVSSKVHYSRQDRQKQVQVIQERGHERSIIIERRERSFWNILGDFAGGF